MSDRAYRRRKMFIDTREQLTFAARSTAHVAIFFLAAAILIYGPGETGNRLSGIQKITNAFLYDINDRLWLLIPAIALVWLVSVIGRHRVVGPIFGFKNALRAVIRGDMTTRLTPRSGDHFAELASLINQAVDTERANLSEIAEQVDILKKAFGDSGQVIDSAAAKGAADHIARVLEHYTLQSPA